MNQYRCETCEFLIKEPVDWGFDPYCHISVPIKLDNWEWVKRWGCASHSEFICQGKKVMDLFVSLITSEMVYDDGDMYYKVNPEKYVEVLGRMVSGDEP